MPSPTARSRQHDQFVEDATVSGLLGSDTVTGLSQAFTSRNVLGTNDSTLTVTAYTVNDGDGGANTR